MEMMMVKNTRVMILFQAMLMPLLISSYINIGHIAARPVTMEELHAHDSSTHDHESYLRPEPSPGLSYSFYEASCPRVHEIVESQMSALVARDPGQAAGILRILFHDCFVQGCDASVLLTTSAAAVTEQTATPNINSLRKSSLHAIDQIKQSLEEVCPATVSCADVISLAAFKGVALVGGPDFPVPLGRRDRPTAADNQTVIANIPAPLFNFSQLLANFTSKGLSLTDLVALSGSHTIGRAHCKSVDFQITPTVSTELFRTYASSLQSKCLPQAPNLLKVVQMDVATPHTFDNTYFSNVLQHRVPFHSDAALLQDPHAKELVSLYAGDQASFFQQFGLSMVKLSQVGVLTGSHGQIRRRCVSPNK